MRPQYHYAAAANWLSDPNGLVHADGEWHLFYQYNPHGEDWGHMSWGHAVSSDLANWRELPVAIAETDHEMIFSGSAVADPDGAAGFGSGALVALYTASAAHGVAGQSQALAWSNDRGRTWQHFPGNPVIDRGLADFRDPNVFWHAASKRWIMVVALSAENRALLFASHDLKSWDELSVIHGAGAPGRVWECPLLIELPVEGGTESRWLFKVDVLHDGPGSGAIYQTGTFDGIVFHPDGPPLEPVWRIADHGSDFYAAIAWHEPRDEKGRPVWIGWLGNHGYQGQLPRQGWRGAMSVPRRISLVCTDHGYALRQELEPCAIASVPQVCCDAIETPSSGRIALPECHDFDLVLADRYGRTIRIERRGSVLLVVRRDGVTLALDLQRKVEGLEEGPLTLWLDVGSLELIGNDGGLVLSLQHRLHGDRLSMELASVTDVPA